MTEVHRTVVSGMGRVLVISRRHPRPGRTPLSRRRHLVVPVLLPSSSATSLFSSSGTGPYPVCLSRGGVGPPPTQCPCARTSTQNRDQNIEETNPHSPLPSTPLDICITRLLSGCPEVNIPTPSLLSTHPHPARCPSVNTPNLTPVCDGIF